MGGDAFSALSPIFIVQEPLEEILLCAHPLPEAEDIVPGIVAKRRADNLDDLACGDSAHSATLTKRHTLAECR